MNIRKIRFIIILALVALVSLIAVQFFWAYNSFRLAKKSFETNVLEAMRNTVETCNKNLTCFELFSKVRIFPEQGFYMMRHPFKNDRFITDRSAAPDTIPMYFANANDNFPFDWQDLKFSWPVDLEMILRFEYLMVDSPQLLPRTAVRPMDLTVDNYRERFAGDKRVEERFKPEMIDSILRENLLNFSISDSFHFGFLRTDSLHLAWASPSADIKALQKSQLRYPLGTDQYFSQPYELAVYFDKPDSVIFAGLKTGLITSAFVIIILLASFYFTIRIILRQRKLSQLKNDFINNMTHEFKTPLANISIALETLEQGSEQSEQRGRILQIIGQETERLQENVEKILQVARFEQGAIQLSLEELNINHVVKKAVSYFESQAQVNPHEIKCELFASPGIIHADETHLINVLCNLIDNAIKYSDKSPVITIRTENNHKGIYLSVIDQGIGIREETQKKIFEKFYRESTGNIHNVKGFGLGLAYVKSIVDSHLGEVSVKSQPGKGSEFIVHLPHHP
jgi:two-component system phosphate regulon sensor histidine kinase PhoR